MLKPSDQQWDGVNDYIYEEPDIELMVIVGGIENVKGTKAIEFMDKWYGKGRWSIDWEKNGVWLADGVFVKNGEWGYRVDDMPVEFILIPVGG